MSDPPDNPNSTDNNEPEQPIAALADLEQDASPAFLGAVRKKIYRRMTATQLVLFAFDVPKFILLEFWNVIVQLLAPANDRKRGPS